MEMTALPLALNTRLPEPPCFSRIWNEFAALAAPQEEEEEEVGTRKKREEGWIMREGWRRECCSVPVTTCLDKAWQLLSSALAIAHAWCC
eukprot:6465205-Pyramimonas_sp.AAC.1